MSDVYLLYVSVRGLPHVVILNNTRQGLPGQLQRESKDTIIIIQSNGVSSDWLKKWVWKNFTTNELKQKHFKILNKKTHLFQNPFKFIQRDVSIKLHNKMKYSSQAQETSRR